MDAAQENLPVICEATEEQLLGLSSLDTSLAFQIILLGSLLLSIYATTRQREGLCCEIAGDAERSAELADVFPFRCVGTAMAIGASGYFLWLALQGMGKLDSASTYAVRHSTELSILEAVLVLAAALVRMTNLVQSQQLLPEGAAAITEEEEPA